MSISFREVEGSRSSGLLPLDAPERVICMRYPDGHIYRHVFRRITAADWKLFFGRMKAEVTGGGRLKVVGAHVSSLRLYSDTIRRAEGYEMRNGRRPEEQQSWPNCIPRDHRLKVTNLLANAVSPAKENAVRTDAGRVSVHVDAVWSEGDPGAMMGYFGLIHRFRPPTAEHRQRLIDVGKTAATASANPREATLPSSYAMYAALYDELVEEVDGYSIGGVALASREQIVREMEGCHKMASVREIFPIVSDRSK
jgi:hypothetical protein